MTTNDVSDTRVSTERLRHFIAYVDLMGPHSDLCVDAWEAKAMAIEILASRHPQPVNEPAEADQWRDLALQFDGHRIECMSILRYVAAAETPHDVRSRISEIGAFLAKPPLPGEAVLAQRLDALRAASSLAPERSSGAAMIEQMSDDEFNRDRSGESPNVGKGDPAPSTSEGQATCDDCAGPVISWRAPDALWNRVMGGPDAKDDPGGIICPNCFIRRAELAGVVPAAWLVAAPQHPPLPKEGEAMTVIDPDQWEPCSPSYLARGGNCDAPRVWNAVESNHYHPRLPPAPVPVTITDGWQSHETMPNDNTIIEVRMVEQPERWNAARFRRHHTVELYEWRPAAALSAKPTGEE